MLLALVQGRTPEEILRADAKAVFSAGFFRLRPAAGLALLEAAPTLRYHKYGYMGLTQMKTTVEVPDDLYRRAKAEAALRGRKLKDLIEEGLRLVLDGPRPRSRQPSLAKLMEKSRGVVDSGIPDVASNKEHLADFGRDARRHR